MIDTRLSKEERSELEDKLLDEADRLLEMLREVIPEAGHLSITAYPNEKFTSVTIFTGEVKENEGQREAVMVLEAWRHNFPDGNRRTVYGS